MSVEGFVLVTGAMVVVSSTLIIFSESILASAMSADLSDLRSLNAGCPLQLMG